MAKWWNGRHSRLKICCLQRREGSSPSFATSLIPVNSAFSKNCGVGWSLNIHRSSNPSSLHSLSGWNHTDSWSRYGIWIGRRIVSICRSHLLIECRWGRRSSYRWGWRWERSLRKSWKRYSETEHIIKTIYPETQTT